MLRSVKQFEGYKVIASDGEVGTVRNFLFDDEHWAIRYLVVETGTYFLERRVLVSPVSFRDVDASTRQFHLELTRDKVKGSPAVDLDQPVSRQHERDFSRYYGWPYYWGYGMGGMWGGDVYPSILAARTPHEPPPKEDTDDPHLRSVREVVGYHIRGTDGDLGHVADFIVEDLTWALRYLVVDTRNWWPGRKVLVAPRWAENISWDDHVVYLDLPRRAIQDSPEWDAEAAVDREYEVLLHEHYGQPGYWSDGDSEPPRRP